MKNSADLGGCFPPRPSASVDITLLDLQNSLYPTRPHPIIAKYVTCILLVERYAQLKMQDVTFRTFFDNSLKATEIIYGNRNIKSHYADNVYSLVGTGLVVADKKSEKMLIMYQLLSSVYNYTNMYVDNETMSNE